jgi:hypothetical protein
MVPLDPAYEAWLAGHVPAKVQMANECQVKEALKFYYLKFGFDLNFEICHLSFRVT